MSLNHDNIALTSPDPQHTSNNHSLFHSNQRQLLPNASSPSTLLPQPTQPYPQLLPHTTKPYPFQQQTIYHSNEQSSNMSGSLQNVQQPPRQALQPLQTLSYQSKISNFGNVQQPNTFQQNTHQYQPQQMQPTQQVFTPPLPQYPSLQNSLNLASVQPTRNHSSFPQQSTNLGVALKRPLDAASLPPTRFPVYPLQGEQQTPYQHNQPINGQPHEDLVQLFPNSNYFADNGVIINTNKKNTLVNSLHNNDNNQQLPPLQTLAAYQSSLNKAQQPQPQQHIQPLQPSKTLQLRSNNTKPKVNTPQTSQYQSISNSSFSNPTEKNSNNLNHSTSTTFTINTRPTKNKSRVKLSTNNQHNPFLFYFVELSQIQPPPPINWDRYLDDFEIDVIQDPIPSKSLPDVSPDAPIPTPLTQMPPHLDLIHDGYIESVHPTSKDDDIYKAQIFSHFQRLVTEFEQSLLLYFIQYGQHPNELFANGDEPTFDTSQSFQYTQAQYHAHASILANMPQNYTQQLVHLYTFVPPEHQLCTHHAYHTIDQDSLESLDNVAEYVTNTIRAIQHCLHQHARYHTLIAHANQKLAFQTLDAYTTERLYPGDYSFGIRPFDDRDYAYILGMTRKIFTMHYESDNLTNFFKRATYENPHGLTRRTLRQLISNRQRTGIGVGYVPTEPQQTTFIKANTLDLEIQVESFEPDANGKKIRCLNTINPITLNQKSISWLTSANEADIDQSDCNKKLQYQMRLDSIATRRERVQKFLKTPLEPIQKFQLPPVIPFWPINTDRPDENSNNLTSSINPINRSAGVSLACSIFPQDHNRALIGVQDAVYGNPNLLPLPDSRHDMYKLPSRPVQLGQGEYGGHNDFSQLNIFDVLFHRFRPFINNDPIKYLWLKLRLIDNEVPPPYRFCQLMNDVRQTSSVSQQAIDDMLKYGKYSAGVRPLDDSEFFFVYNMQKIDAYKSTLPNVVAQSSFLRRVTADNCHGLTDDELDRVDKLESLSSRVNKIFQYLKNRWAARKVKHEKYAEWIRLRLDYNMVDLPPDVLEQYNSLISISGNNKDHDLYNNDGSNQGNGIQLVVPVSGGNFGSTGSSAESNGISSGQHDQEELFNPFYETPKFREEIKSIGIFSGGIRPLTSEELTYLYGVPYAALILTLPSKKDRFIYLTRAQPNNPHGVPTSLLEQLQKDGAYPLKIYLRLKKHLIERWRVLVKTALYHHLQTNPAYSPQSLKDSIQERHEWIEKRTSNNRHPLPAHFDYQKALEQLDREFYFPYLLSGKISDPTLCLDAPIVIYGATQSQEFSLYLRHDSEGRPFSPPPNPIISGDRVSTVDVTTAVGLGTYGKQWTVAYGNGNVNQTPGIHSSYLADAAAMNVSIDGYVSIKDIGADSKGDKNNDNDVVSCDTEQDGEINNSTGDDDDDDDDDDGDDDDNDDGDNNDNDDGSINDSESSNPNLTQQSDKLIGNKGVLNGSNLPNSINQTVNNAINNSSTPPRSNNNAINNNPQSGINIDSIETTSSTSNTTTPSTTTTPSPITINTDLNGSASNNSSFFQPRLELQQTQQIPSQPLKSNLTLNLIQPRPVKSNGSQNGHSNQGQAPLLGAQSNIFPVNNTLQSINNTAYHQPTQLSSHQFHHFNPNTNPNSILQQTNNHQSLRPTSAEYFPTSTLPIPIVPITTSSNGLTNNADGNRNQFQPTRHVISPFPPNTSNIPSALPNTFSNAVGNVGGTGGVGLSNNNFPFSNTNSIINVINPTTGVGLNNVTGGTNNNNNNNQLNPILTIRSNGTGLFSPNGTGIQPITQPFGVTGSPQLGAKSNQKNIIPTLSTRNTQTTPTNPILGLGSIDASIKPTPSTAGILSSLITQSKSQNSAIMNNSIIPSTTSNAFRGVLPYKSNGTYNPNQLYDVNSNTTNTILSTQCNAGSILPIGGLTAGTSTKGQSIDIFGKFNTNPISNVRNSAVNSVVSTNPSTVQASSLTGSLFPAKIHPIHPNPITGNSSNEPHPLTHAGNGQLGLFGTNPLNSFGLSNNPNQFNALASTNTNGQNIGGPQTGPKILPPFLGNIYNTATNNPNNQNMIGGNNGHQNSLIPDPNNIHQLQQHQSIHRNLPHVTQIPPLPTTAPRHGLTYMTPNGMQQPSQQPPYPHVPLTAPPPPPLPLPMKNSKKKAAAATTQDINGPHFPPHYLAFPQLQQVLNSAPYGLSSKEIKNKSHHKLHPFDNDSDAIPSPFEPYQQSTVAHNDRIILTIQWPSLDYPPSDYLHSIYGKFSGDIKPLTEEEFVFVFGMSFYRYVKTEQADTRVQFIKRAEPSNPHGLGEGQIKQFKRISQPASKINFVRSVLRKRWAKRHVPQSSLAIWIDHRLYNNILDLPEVVFFLPEAQTTNPYMAHLNLNPTDYEINQQLLWLFNLLETQYRLEEESGLIPSATPVALAFSSPGNGVEDTTLPIFSRETITIRTTSNINPLLLALNNQLGPQTPTFFDVSTSLLIYSLTILTKPQAEIQAYYKTYNVRSVPKVNYVPLPPLKPVAPDPNIPLGD